MIILRAISPAPVLLLAIASLAFPIAFGRSGPILTALSAQSAADQIDAPRWTTAPASASAGYYSLGWQVGPPAPGGLEFELQESDSPEFLTVRVIYQGADTGSTISGRPDGTFYYRLQAAAPPATAAQDSAREREPVHAGWRKSAWSATHAVTVEHHPLARAFAFLATGAVVFLMTAAMILLGTLRARKSKSGAVT